MNRTLKLIAFLVCIFTFSITTLAQDALPLPAAADEDAPRTTIVLDKPGYFHAISPGVVFQWTNIAGASGYDIKFYIHQTKQTLMWDPGVFCSAKCNTLGDPTELFEIARTGYDVDWTVITKVNGVKVKSEARRGIINEVGIASPLSPDHLAQAPRNQFTMFKWAHQGLVVKYTLVVKNANTGEIVLKAKMPVANYCWDSIPYDLCQFSFGGAHPTVQQVLKENKHYIWFVKSLGPTGETAKSNTFHLFTLSDV